MLFFFSLFYYLFYLIFVYFFFGSLFYADSFVPFIHFFFLLYYHAMLCNSVTKHAFSFFLRLYSHIGIVSIFGKKEKKNSLWFHFSSMRTVQCVWENLLNRDVRGLIEHSSLLTLSFVSVYNNTHLKINNFGRSNWVFEILLWVGFYAIWFVFIFILCIEAL